jgi:hypothetical protein
VTVGLGIVFLALAVAGSAWYFGRGGREIPFLVGIASFSAACGVLIGFSSQVLFAILVPGLASVYGGTLLCAVRIGQKQSRVAPSSGTCNRLASGSAASGIPLLLGAYFGNLIHDLPHLTVDLSRVLAVLVLLLATIATVYLVGRERGERPLPFAGAAFGAFVGVATGLSPHAVVAYVAPACLTLFAGIASYSFSTGKEEEQLTIGKILFCFGVLLIVGLFLGASVRVGLGISAVPGTLYGFAAVTFVSLALGILIGSEGETSRRWWTRFAKPKAAFAGAIGFAMSGAGIGLAMGLSKEPVIQIALPALLAVFAGLAAYAVGDASTDAEKSRHRALLAAFALTILLGSFGGYALRGGESVREVGEVRKPLEEGLAASQTEDGGEPTSSIPIATEDVVSILAALDRLESHLLYVEGTTTRSAVVVAVKDGWQGTLRIRDCVNDKEILRTEPGACDLVAGSSERLEIRWPRSEGRDAVTIWGWERVTPRDGGWVVEGDGEPVDTGLAAEQGEWFVLVYP